MVRAVMPLSGPAATTNFAGEDLCEECGADLRTIDVPQDAIDFHGRLLGEHLDALGIERPPTVVAGTSARAAIARMKDDGLDCLLVVDGDRAARDRDRPGRDPQAAAAGRSTAWSSTRS